MERFSGNPIIKPQDLKPSREDFEVVGVFNAAATTVKEKTCLLLRVAERPVTSKIVSPFFNSEKREIDFIHFDKSQNDLDLTDSRLIKISGETYLTSISHFRRAWSDDGKTFRVEDSPALFPENEYEEFGIEDPRISYIEGKYFITYTAVSHYGAGECLAISSDMIDFERKGFIFPPDNRDVVLFPEKINNKYVALHRPNPNVLFGRGKPSIWIATSENLIDWGDHKCLLEPQEDLWDSERIGGGATPIKTDKGWAIIYHGVDKEETYSLGAALLSDSLELIARSKEPILAPQETYETSGFFNNVVFTDGAILRENDQIDIYYGASDESICLATASIESIFP